jgi:hypothetical protein
MVMLVYDATSQESFNHCAKWLEMVKRHRVNKDRPLHGARPAPSFHPSGRLRLKQLSWSTESGCTETGGARVVWPGVLVANKTDLRARVCVAPAAAESWAQNNGLQFFEASAVRQTLAGSGLRLLHQLVIRQTTRYLPR